MRPFWMLTLVGVVSANFNLIFVGNPGVGKSTLASSMTGAEFERGVKFGSGLTTELSWQDAPLLAGVRVADTPGLQDLKIKEQAAKAISQALKDSVASGRAVRIVFVVKTVSGRIHPAELWTINQVMKSIVLPESVKEKKKDLYSVIVNQCDFLEDDEFINGGKTELEMEFKTNPILKGFTTNAVAFAPYLPSLRGKNKRADFGNLAQWLQNSPKIHIQKANAIDVKDLNDYDDLIAKLEKQNEEHRKQMEANANRLQEMQRKHDAEMVKFQREMQNNNRKDPLMDALGGFLGAAAGALPLLFLR